MIITIIERNYYDISLKKIKLIMDNNYNNVFMNSQSIKFN